MKYRLFYLGILQMLWLSCHDYSLIYDYLGYLKGDIELVKFDNYITLGDDEAKVYAILGTPSSKNVVTSIQVEKWKYKEGTIIIKDGEVYGWFTGYKLPIKLPVKLQLKTSDNDKTKLSLGADFWTAIAMYGAPSSINLSSIHMGRVKIDYGYDDLTFKYGKLISYDNRDEYFDIYFDIKDQGNKTFALGSTQEEVLSCQGVPSFVDVKESYSQWKYKHSSINFDAKGIVTSWDNHNNLNLTDAEKNVALVENQNTKINNKDNWFENSYPKLIYNDENFVNLGDMKSDVLKLLQEPITKTVSKGGKETWKYKGGTIYIKNDAVIGWYNRRELLKVRHLPTNQEKDIIKLRLGSSFEDVLNRCGTPSEINLLAHVLLKLTFGKVTLYFRNNKLAGYSNAKGKFEFEFEKEPTTVCNGDLQIEVGTKSDDIYACFGMPIAISDGRRYTKWLYDDYRFTIKGGEVTDYSTR